MSISLPQNVGPYLLESLIGRGGMGAVYRAYDERLGRRVAIKHVRPDRQSGEASRRRLRREARAAACLAHPSIIQIFDILGGEDGEWIVMEWIDGPNLGALLRRGPLDVATATQLGHQIADGLAHAHSQDVVHRDLKVENVMLSPLGRAKILDFGLAKQLTDDEESLTASGVVIGTRRSMSPEQAQGFPADERSDLFSLGVLLYECLTGQSPFRAATAVATLTRVCTYQPEPVSSLAANVPDDLSHLINRLLEKQAAYRARSAQKVARELAKIHRRLDPGSTLEALTSSAAVGGSETFDFRDALDTPTLSGAGRVSNVGRVSGVDKSGVGESADPEPTKSSGSFLPIRQSLLRATGLVVLLTLLSAFAVPSDLRRTVALWLLGPKAGPMDSSATTFLPQGSLERDSEVTIAEPVRIVVLPFESLGAPENAYFAAGITEEISRRLTLISGLGVISRTSARRYVGGAFSLDDIGRSLDVEYVLEGTVTWPPSAADGEAIIRVTPRLVRVEDDLQIWTEGYERKLEGFLQLQSEIAAAVATNLDLGMQQTEGRALESRGTSNPAAYFAFLRGLDHKNQPQFSIQRLRKAAKMFQHAIKLDPSFAEAHAELSRVYSFLYLNNSLTDEEIAVAADSLEVAKRLAPLLPSVRLASAFYSFDVEQDYRVAVEEFESLARELPHDPEVLTGLGLVHRRNGRFEEAIRLLERSSNLDPVNQRLTEYISLTHRALRSYKSADSWLRKALQLAPDSADVLGLRAMNTMMWKGCGPPGISAEKCSTLAARRVLKDSPIGDDPQLYYIWLQLDILEASINPGEASRYYRRIVERLDDRIGGSEPTPYDCSLHWYVSFSLDQLAQHDRAVQFVEACRESFDDYLRGRPLADAMWGRLGIAEAYLGNRSRALEASAKAVEIGRLDHYAGPRYKEYRMLALVLLGEIDEPLTLLEELAQLPYKNSISAPLVILDPLLEPLRDDPRFASILTELSSS